MLRPEGREENPSSLAPRKADPNGKPEEERKRNLKGTGGSSLIPFLRQARDETGSLPLTLGHDGYSASSVEPPFVGAPGGDHSA